MPHEADAGVWIRNVANLVNLSTPLGLVVALGSRSRLRVAAGLIVAERARLPFLPASAMTVGSVVLIPGRSLDDVAARLPRLLEHESEHAWQWALFAGLPFLPLYLAATAWSWLRTRDRAAGNWFEKQAGLVSGGYLPEPGGLSAAGGPSAPPAGTRASGGAA